MKTYKESVSFEALYESMWRCKQNGKIKKASVARFVIHGIEETLKLEKELSTGKYLPRKPHNFTITYPKKRPCSSVHIRDRIVQRSLNDNVIYPQMTKSFIWDNMACQKGKGTTRAMDRIDRFLHRYYINNGNSNEGWVWQWDIQGYYPNMRHDKARECFDRRMERETVDNAEKWLQRQYPYDIGYEPGSQMVQILGISMLDNFDHALKERLKAKIYLRYMDDGFVISSNKEFLKECWEEMEKELEKIGLHFHQKKTRIYRLAEGINVLGFTFRLTKTGKVIRIINPKNVKHERKKLVRMAHLVDKGLITREKFDECYDAWKAHAELGNSYKLLQRMDAYVKSLFKEESNESAEKNKVTVREGNGRTGKRESRRDEGRPGLQHHDGQSGGSGGRRGGRRR